MTVDDDLRVQRRIAAPRSAVYAYLTDSGRWARWQGASAWIEPIPGGRFRMSMADGSTAEGRFVQLIPEARVVFTWGWQNSPTLPPGSSTVEIDLESDGEGTILHLTHRGLPASERQSHQAGWDHFLPRLAVAATGEDPGPDLVG